MNGDPKIPVNLNIDYNATNLIDSTIVPPLERVGNSLQSVWNLTVGWLDYFSEKTDIKRKQNLIEYQSLINSKVSSVPKDYIQEPAISIIGPAIKSSEFFFEEIHYRDMFSTLIGSSFDKRMNNIVHPSFATIITELSGNDARILKEFSSYDNTAYFPISRTQVNNSENVVMDPFIYDLMILKATFEFNTVKQQSLSLDNLIRLGILSCDWAKYYNDSAYDFFDKNPEILSIRNNYGNDYLSEQKGILSVTNYGRAFINVCL